MFWNLFARIERKWNRMRIKAAFRGVRYNASEVVLGADCDRDFQINFPANLSIGNGTVLNGCCFINAFGGVSIGEYCHIGKGLTVFSHNHNWKSEKYLPYDEENIIRPVKVGDAVWIGANVTLAPGAEVGDGAIISSGAVVFGKVAPGTIVRGNPAVEIGKREEEVFRSLLEKRQFF